jgi:hypothetical protein
VLRLQNLFIHKDSWPLMLTTFAGAGLSRLRKLRVHIFSDVSDSVKEAYVPMPRHVVQQMVDACPNLVVLQLVGNGLLSSGGHNHLPEVRHSPPVSLAPLGQLQHLTSLRVHSVRAQVCFLCDDQHTFCWHGPFMSSRCCMLLDCYCHDTA